MELVSSGKILRTKVKLNSCADELPSGSVGRSVGGSVGRLVGRSVGRSVRRSVGWFVKGDAYNL
jgi:hypothetical protein